MSFENRNFTYIITSYPVDTNILDVVPESVNSVVRINKAQNQCILKYNWPKPAVIAEVTEYTLDEIITYINANEADWNY